MTRFPDAIMTINISIREDMVRLTVELTCGVPRRRSDVRDSDAQDSDGGGCCASDASHDAASSSD